MHLKLFNEFIGWSMFRGSQPSPIYYSPSIVDMLFPVQIELFPKTNGIGVTWLEDEYIPIPLPVR